ncbi:MAG TPA: LLM class flavin-dependent oxidoreductase [Actinomycetota bacterium]
MRLAIQTPPEHTDAGALRDVWVAADELGFDAAFTFDHLVPLNPAPPGASLPGAQLEGWVMLATLAASTRRLRVGTLASGVTYRHPVMLAKMAVTLDHATGGRAILGVGAAWHEAEHRMFGLEFPAVGSRMGRLEETLEMVSLLYGGGGPVNFDGRHYRLRDAVFEPKPLRPNGIPILVGGSGDRLRSIAARHADIFNSFFPPWQWREVNDDLDHRLTDAGRRPGDLERSAFVFAELSRDPRRERRLIEHFQRTRGGTEDEVRSRVVLGDPDRAVEVLRSYAGAGISLAVLNLRPPFDPAGLAWLAGAAMREVSAA